MAKFVGLPGESCGVCLFGVADGASDDDKVICRRRAPVVLLTPTRGIQGVGLAPGSYFPQPLRDWWCGDGEARVLDGAGSTLRALPPAGPTS